MTPITTIIPDNMALAQAVAIANATGCDLYTDWRRTVASPHPLAGFHRLHVSPLRTPRTNPQGCGDALA